MTRPLESEGLNFSRGGGLQLQDVSLSLRAGELTILQGANGTGKSTLLELLAGVHKVKRGSIHMGGVDVTEWPLHRRASAGLGYLPQGSCLVPGLDVWANVALSGVLEKDIHEMVEALGLSGVVDRAVTSLSGGERRRVELARCLVRPTSVLLLDEPLWGLDTIQADAVKGCLGQRVAEGAAVLIADPRAEWGASLEVSRVELREGRLGAV